MTRVPRAQDPQPWQSAALVDSTVNHSLEGRHEAVQRMVADALAEPSAIQANLQICGGDLLEMSVAMKVPILLAMQSCDAERLEQLLPLIDTYTKVCRQADRLLRLDFDISEARARQ